MKSFLVTGGFVLVYMTGWFIAAQVRGRNDIADVAWGLGIILAAAVSLLFADTFSPRGLRGLIFRSTNAVPVRFSRCPKGTEGIFLP